ncbi:uncharacterized protein (TIGR02453 family) [Pedobacter sp. UYP30]|uniref:DUF2461 domain-containing protein n=1 Tax=Pedobacter sp. UYP30 TaxID=1756400 RepID=UPI003390AE59
MLKKETLNFIEAVAANNNREWFAENKYLYEEAKIDVLQLAAELIPKLAKVDPMISADSDPKKSLMRIYRDVRFSKNKDPYKTNFGIWFSANGKGGNEPGYYLNIAPGASFLAGGYWMPDTAHLKLIRQEIDYNATGFKEIIDNPSFKEQFFLNGNNALKKAPKGYNPEDPNIELLKLKSFEVLTKLADEEFFKATIVNKLISSYQKIQPLVAFLREAVKP